MMPRYLAPKVLMMVWSSWLCSWGCRGGLAAFEIGGALGFDHVQGTLSPILPLVALRPWVMRVSVCWTVIS